MHDDYRYGIALYSPEGGSLGQVPALVDWEPAKEWAALEALRRGGHDTVAATSAATVLPLWHAKLGQPFMDGFRVSVGINEGAPFPVDFSNEFFKKHAEAASSQLVAQGVLSEGDSFLYVVVAHRVERPEPREGAGAGFTVEEIPPAVTILPGDLAAHTARADLFESGTGGDLPVFVHQQLLAEITLLSQGSGGKETGGVLIGDIHRDTDDGDLFLVVTAQIPARHTQAHSTRLTFTAETWDAAQAAIRLRGTDEQMLGWWHCHPVKEWCKSCPPEKRAGCTLFEDVFSADDKALHRTVFPRAWNVALLVSELPDRDPSISMHGWREGRIERRGFHMLAGPIETGRR